MKRIIAIAVLAFVGACAALPSALGPSPEAQIVNGANAVTAAAGVGTVLLKNGKISVDQAKSYRAILGTASDHLNVAAVQLRECRGRTRSAPSSNPDPCAPSVAGDIALAIQVVGEVHRTLTSKQ